MIKFRYGLLKHLIALGHRVYVVAPYDEFVEKIEELGCIHIDIKVNRKGINPIEDLLLIRNLVKIYKKIKPDIIFNYSIKPIIYGSIAAKIVNIKSVAVNIGLGYTFINESIISKISHKMYKLALLFPISVWFINEDDKNEFIKKKLVNKNKTLVLPSEGINTEYFSSKKTCVKDEKIVFLLIARMLWDKGIQEYYEAAKIIKKKYTHVEFQLLGNIDLENPKGIDLEMIKRWHESGVIQYLGYKKDVRPFIDMASCIVLPSYREGKGMTLIEAGSMSKPLVATNVAGCKDIVKDGYNGYLCEAKNVDSLAESLVKMINLSFEDRKQFGLNSKKFIADNFDEKKVISIYTDFLTQLKET